MFNCSQIINESTRVTPNSSTVLDHIVTNSTDKIKEKGGIPSGFSDHFMVFCSRGVVAGDGRLPPIVKRGVVAGDGRLPPIVKRVRSTENYTKELLVQSLRVF